MMNRLQRFSKTKINWHRLYLLKNGQSWKRLGRFSSNDVDRFV